MKLFKGNKLEPFYKSEKIPEQKKSVYQIVGKTFESEVININKDILIEFYSSSCQKCQAFAPKLEELALIYKTNSFVRIAKMDITKNDIVNIDIFEIID